MTQHPTTLKKTHEIYVNQTTVFINRHVCVFHIPSFKHSGHEFNRNQHISLQQKTTIDKVPEKYSHINIVWVQISYLRTKLFLFNAQV